MFLSYELFIWYDDSFVESTGTKYRGLNPEVLAPHKFTPMLGVHARVADRAFPEGKSLGRNRVILVVRRL